MISFKVFFFMKLCIVACIIIRAYAVDLVFSRTNIHIVCAIGRRMKPFERRDSRANDFKNLGGMVRCGNATSNGPESILFLDNGFIRKGQCKIIVLNCEGSSVVIEPNIYRVKWVVVTTLCDIIRGTVLKILSPWHIFPKVVLRTNSCISTSSVVKNGHPKLFEHSQDHIVFNVCII